MREKKRIGRDYGMRMSWRRGRGPSDGKMGMGEMDFANGNGNGKAEWKRKRSMLMECLVM